MDDKTQAQLKEIFETLPKPIQAAITSADVQKKLREAAETHKLHLDQWDTLENEVLMTLFGLKPIEKLQENIKKEVGVSDETAAELTGDISEIVFAPIRQELERQLEHPEAKEKELTGVETARESILASKPVAGSQQPGAKPVASSLEPVTNSEAATSYRLQATGSMQAAPEPAPLTTKPIPPATPPPPPPTERAVRAPTSSVYKAGESSTARKNVHEDPYREPPQ